MLFSCLKVFSRDVTVWREVPTMQAMSVLFQRFKNPLPVAVLFDMIQGPLNALLIAGL